MVNKVKALGSKKWTDRMLTERLMRAYTPINYNVVSLICQDTTYKKMTSDDVLGRIINHEMYIEEANYIKNLYKGVRPTKKQEIAFKASKKSKNKQVVAESSSEEEEEGSVKCDAKEMALFMRKFKKYMNKKKFSKGEKKFNTKSTTKRICYNCGKHGHFIANWPFEHRDDNDDKKKSKFYKKDRGCKRSDKPYKKNSYGKAHISQEWESNDESSNSDSDGVATVAIKGMSSSSKSHFPKHNQEKQTFLMVKESKDKVKTKGSSSPKYVSSDDNASDDNTPLPHGINEKAAIKMLGKELIVWDQLFQVQEDLLEQERKNTCEHKRLLKLEKEKNENLAQELAKARRLSLVSRAQVVLFKTHMMSCKRLIQILKCNLMLLGLAHPKIPKPLLAMKVKDAIMLILMLFVLKENIPMLSKCLYNLVMKL
jgi:hypothetical protein